MRLALGASFLILSLAAQPGPRFEAVSIKLSPWNPGTRAPGERGAGGGGCPTSMKADPARVEIRCATLAMLIGYAYRESPDHVKGPEWMMAVGSPRFDIAATLPAGASKQEIPEMLKAMLADRFQLVLHAGENAGPIYALVTLRSGLAMKPAVVAGAAASEDDQTIGVYGAIHDRKEGDAIMITSPRIGRVKQTSSENPLHLRWESDSIGFKGLAELLDKSAPVSVPIVDMTGLPGRYQLSLEVSLADRPEPQELEASVVRAFNDGLRKLGLQLERRHGTIPVLIVDRVEKTPAAN